MREPVYFAVALLFCFGLCTLALALLIPRLRAMRMGQIILEIGPSWHAPKAGTPTMGGVVFLLVAGVALLLFPPLALRENALERVYPFLIAGGYCIANGAVGILDDLTKLRRHQNEGLSPTQKLILQTTLAAAFLAVLRITGVLEGSLTLPLVGELPLGFFVYFLLLVLLVGIVNCANLTDGIDGLASGVSVVIFTAYALLSIRAEQLSPTLLSALLLGCACAFFLFNHHPAKIFMGDTGSLFLGAGAGAVPLLLGAPHLALVCGIVYVIEGASVILQVLYYKKTKKRLFLMAPIHHHLEKCGWSEGRIVTVFVLASTLAAALALVL